MARMLKSCNESIVFYGVRETAFHKSFFAGEDGMYSAIIWLTSDGVLPVLTSPEKIRHKFALHPATTLVYHMSSIALTPYLQPHPHLFCLSHGKDHQNREETDQTLAARP
jgi:hypothetical protein